MVLTCHSHSKSKEYHVARAPLARWYNVCMERSVPFEKGEYYHVFNRGVDKRQIFFVDRDWDVFQWMLFARNGRKRIDIPKSKSLGEPWRIIEQQRQQSEQLVNIIAYALMENHFHLLLKEKQDGGISKFMLRLQTSFAMYMNTKYDRSGPLMCRPFRSRHIDSDEYLKWVLSYIHLNPVDKIESKWRENGIEKLRQTQDFLRNYKHSSYQDYFSKKARPESVVINKSALPAGISCLDNLNRMLKEYSKREYLDEGIKNENENKASR
jgi:REP element-mobilizing transposase RayT